MQTKLITRSCALVVLLMASVVCAQPAPQVGPLNPWPWTATVGGNLVLNNPGFETGDLTGWLATSYPFDPLRCPTGPTPTLYAGNTNPTPHTGSWEAQIANAQCSVGADMLSQNVALTAGGVYDLDGYLASSGNSNAMFTISAPSSTSTASAVVLTLIADATSNCNDLGCPVALYTTVTCSDGSMPPPFGTGTCTPAPFCLNLQNEYKNDACNAVGFPPLIPVTSSVGLALRSICGGGSTWVYPKLLTACASGYTVQGMAANGNTALSGIDYTTPIGLFEPALESGVSILNTTMTVIGVNNLAGIRLSIRGPLTATGASNALMGNGAWRHVHNLTTFIGDSSVKVNLADYGQPSGLQSFDDISLTQLQSPPVETFLMYPNYLATDFSGLDAQVQYRANIASPCATAVPDCAAGQCEMELKNSGGTIVGHQCVTPATQAIPPWPTATLPLSSQAVGTYTITLAGNSVYAPSYKVKKVAAVPSGWSGWIDPQGWLRKRSTTGPQFAVGSYDFGGPCVSVADCQANLNGVVDAPNPVVSITESGTNTATVTLANPITGDSRFYVGHAIALSQFTTPLNAIYDTAGTNGFVVTARDTTANTVQFVVPNVPVTVAASLGTSVSNAYKFCADCAPQTFPCAGEGIGAMAYGINGGWECVATPINDGVAGGTHGASQGYGSVGVLSRKAGMDIYLNYGWENSDPALVTLPLLSTLNQDGVLWIDPLNLEYWPHVGKDPVLTGAVPPTYPTGASKLYGIVSADSTYTGCDCGAAVSGDNSNWGPNGTHQCGPNPVTIPYTDSTYPFTGAGGGPGYGHTAGAGSRCSMIGFGDLDYRETVLDGVPGNFGTYIDDEPTMELWNEVATQTSYVKTYSPNIPSFGALLGGGAAGNNIDSWRLWANFTDIFGADRYPFVYNKPFGGTSPAMEVGLGGTQKTPAYSGIQQTAWLGVLASNGNPYANPIKFGARPFWLVSQFWGGGTGAGWPNREQLQDSTWLSIVSGAQGDIKWTFGPLGVYSLASCPDYPKNAPACKAEKMADLIYVTQGIRQYQQFITGTRVAIATTDTGCTTGSLCQGGNNFDNLPNGVFGMAASGYDCGVAVTKIFTVNANSPTKTASGIVADNNGHTWQAAGTAGSMLIWNR